MMKTGLVPERVSALGIEFTKTDQNTILFITAMCIAYFLVGFVITVVCDFVAWLHALDASEWAIFPVMRKMFQPTSFSSRSLAIVRFLYEIAVPLLLGCYSLKLLWRPSMQALVHFF